MKSLRKNMPKIKAMMAQTEFEIEKETGVRVKLFIEPYDEWPNDLATDLIKQCCEIWELDIADLRYKTRRREIVQMRFVLSLLLCIKTSLTLSKIAHRIGYSDHTDVIHARGAAADYREVNDEYFMAFYNPVKHLFDETEVK